MPTRKKASRRLVAQAPAAAPAFFQNAGAIVFVAMIATGVPYLALLMMHSGLGGFSLATWLDVPPTLTSGIFLGIIAASSIYLLTTWYAIRDRSQVFLMMMMVCLMLHVAAGAGFFDRFGTKEYTVPLIKHGALMLFYVFSTIFTILYLELDAVRAHIRYALYVVMVLPLAGLGLAIIDLSFTGPFLPYLGLVVLFFLVVAGLNALWLRTGGAVAHIMAFGVVFLGTLSDISLSWSAVKPAQSDFSVIAYALCAMLFAVVIASQFARRQEMKERELATSNERFRMAALGSNEGLFDLDLPRRVYYFSDRFRRIFGANLAGHSEPLRGWMSLIHPEDRYRVRKMLVRFLGDRNRAAITIDHRVLRPDNRIIWISTTAVAVRNEEGSLVRLVGSVGDVTEKKRAEMRLRASEARFRSITEAHPVPVLIATLREGEIVFASQGAEAALKTPHEKLIGGSLDNFTGAELRRDLMLEIQNHERVDLMEAVLSRPDGTEMPVAISARLIHYERRACAVLGLADVSERKAAELRVKETEAALQQSEKLAALGGLLAGVAHELNNPLSVIVGQAALLKESAPEPKVMQRADKIRTAGERCSRIVRSFLALARRKPSERKPVALNTLIEESLELLAFQLRTDNIELKRKLDANLPQALADPDQMIQVITNLVINAKQALQDRPAPKIVEVSTWHKPDDAAGETLFVSVTDNGPGVPKDITKRIFEPFFTTKPAGAGTGVGLSLCHNIIETHGGRIWVEDAAGGGARFVFSLPVSAQTVVRDNMEVMVEGAAPKVPPLRILIVDDEIELGQTLADILIPDGHQITMADNGKKALDVLNAKEIDLIISDLRMPVMDGPTLYRELEKTMPRYIERIMFVTGDTLSTTVREFLTSYALDVIEKPYAPEDVRKGIALHVRQNRKPPKKDGDEARAPL
ncbi:MAG TPA: ATP-binding protein [Alphaproteobacteria bacterium]|nr:ATP-binding protein [Alphaproteobacteria bacterium]